METQQLLPVEWRTRGGRGVEDEPQVLVLADSILSDAGHETKTAANAFQALALMRLRMVFSVREIVLKKLAIIAARRAENDNAGGSDDRAVDEASLGSGDVGAALAVD